MPSFLPGCADTTVTKLYQVVLNSGELSPRHKRWWAFEKLAPSLQSVTIAMEEDIHFKSNFPKMVIPTQGMAQHSARAVVDLGSPRSSTTDFLDEPQGNHSPPGCPKHSCNNWLLQELELKPTDHHLIISPHFDTLKRIKT